MDPGFEITTSLRWKASDEPVCFDVGFYGLPQLDGIPLHYHRDRLLAASEAFEWPVVTLLCSGLGLDLLLSKLTSFNSTLPSKTGTYKLRLTVSYAGTISISSSPPITSALFPLCPSSSPFERPSSSIDALPVVYMGPTTIVPSQHTRHKTTDRSTYNAILSRLPKSITSLPPTSAEVLLYNPFDQIVECLYSTPYFQRDHNMITPEDGCGGNLGVTRRLALEKGWCSPRIILKEDVKDGEVIWLSNAVRGFWAARVVLKLPESKADVEDVGKSKARTESRASTRSRTRGSK